MTKRNRSSRPKGELEIELRDQLRLLRHSCEHFDKGMEVVGRHIALIIRVLVHQHGQSRALLDQLGLREMKFLDSAGPINPRNLLPEHHLIAIRMQSAEVARYIPRIVVAGDGLPPMRPVRFQDWWNEPIIRDADRRTFSRRSLVLNVADTDGGAHVDPELDEEYMALSRRNSLGWETSQAVGFSLQLGNAHVRPPGSPLQGRPELVCMRAIGHELLCTIHRNVPTFADDAKPVIPIAA